jgi:hypothetical protein
LIGEKIIQSNIIDISYLESGVYLLRVITNNGETSAERFVKK